MMDVAIHGLLRLDYSLLYFFNVTLASPILDQFWLTLTDLHKIGAIRFAVLPLGLFWLFYKYRWDALRPILTIALAVGMADAVAYRLIKPVFERQRPTQNFEISAWQRPVGDAHGMSFPSNHAANCFAGAYVLSHFFRRKRKYFYAFAGLVAISRVGLGVHYPSDILGGALLGLFCGAVMVRAYRWSVSRWDMNSLFERENSEHP